VAVDQLQHQGDVRRGGCPVSRSQPLRRTPLPQRTAPMPRGRPLAARAAARKAPRYTGPDTATRLLVLERDGYRCVCCGTPVLGRAYSLQHRKRRSQCGDNSPANLLTVLGDGTRGHHARIDSRAWPEDEARGYTVRSWQDPALVPVMIFGSPGGPGVTMFATRDGRWAAEAPAGAP